MGQKLRHKNITRIEARIGERRQLSDPLAVVPHLCIKVDVQDRDDAAAAARLLGRRDIDESQRGRSRSGRADTRGFNGDEEDGLDLTGSGGRVALAWEVGA